MKKRIALCTLAALLLVCALLPGCKPVEEKPPKAEIAFATEAADDMYKVTMSITFAPDTYVWNGNYEIHYDPALLELQGEPEMLQMEEISNTALSVKKADGELYATFLKAGYTPGTYAFAAYTFKQLTDKPGELWIVNAKVEDCGPDGDWTGTQVLNYAKLPDGLKAPGWNGAGKYRVNS